MSKIANGIRAKRFQIKSGSDVKLLVETETGERFTFKVRDGSLTGLGAWIEGDQSDLSSLAVAKMIPESKLIWADQEQTLGRLVVRAQILKEGKVFFGFSCVDAKVPLLGSLSKEFDAINSESPLEFELSSKKFTLATFMESDHSNLDLFHKCKEYALLKEDALKNPLWQYYPVRHEADNLRVKLVLPRVKRPTNYINFASYDYFGFATDPEVREAAKKAIDRFGVSATGTPPLSGKTVIHEELEARLAQVLGKEDAMLFTSGFSANVGSLTSLLAANDLVVADILSHASIHDGLNASKSKVRLFRHNSNKHLDNLLTEHRGAHSGALTITEGLFSMDGDVPNLKEFVRVSKKHNTRIFIDEVHSFGVMGANGLGAAERCGVLDDVDLYIGSLSKGFGAGGGFVAGSKEVISWMRSFARAGMFSSAVSPCAAAGALKSLEINQTRPERRKKLLENIKQFLDGLRELGYNPKSDAESPIIPVIIGDQELMGRMNQVLIEHGVFVNPIIFPAVSLTSCRFRFSLSSAHSYSDIQLALVALKRAIETVGLSFDDESKLASTA